MLTLAPIGAPYLTEAQVKNSSCDVGDSNQLDPQDYSMPTLVMLLVTSLSAILFVAFFETPYKRMTAESEYNQEKT